MNTRSPRTRLLAATIVGLGLIGGSIGMANAQDDGPQSEAPPTIEEVGPGDRTDEEVQADPRRDDEPEPDGAECEAFLPGPDDVAAIQAEMAALKAAFDEAGIEYTEELDEELGVSFVEWDVTDEAANEVAEAVFDELGLVDGIVEHEGDLPFEAEGEIVFGGVGVVPFEASGEAFLDGEFPGDFLEDCGVVVFEGCGEIDEFDGASSEEADGESEAA